MPPRNIMIFRKATYFGSQAHASATALIDAHKGTSEYRGAMWDDFEDGSGVVAYMRADVLDIFVCDSDNATLWHKFRLQATFGR